MLRNKSKRIKVMIVDDHALVRDGLKALLCHVKEIQVVGVLSGGRDALKALKEVQPDVVIMDICMPGMSGLEALKEINKVSTKTKVILLSVEIKESFVMDAVKNGMKGYLPKDTKKERLIEAIKRVYDGEEYFDHRVSEVIFKKLGKMPGKKKSGLPKSKLVLEIAAILGMELIAGIVLSFVGF